MHTEMRQILETILKYHDPKFLDKIGLGKQCRPRSRSTLFAILSASFGLITLW